MNDIQYVSKETKQGVFLGTSADFVWIDVGTDCLAVGSLREFGRLERNESIEVHVNGFDPECLYLVSLGAKKSSRDWQELKKAYEQKAILAGVVTSFVKGGFIVDVGLPAFMPTSRSGGRDKEERERLIGQEILCTIEELEESSKNIVVDRRRLLEAAELWGDRLVIEGVKVGELVRGKVCTLTDFGAFIDLGGVDGLLHVRDISWKYVDKPSNVFSVGQEVEVLVKDIDAKGRVSLSLKALQTDPWMHVEGKYRKGDRVVGTITSVTGFGAFVELEPGIEGLVHQADLSWSRLPPHELVSPGAKSEFVILDVNPADRRIALSRKETMDDPWVRVEERFPVGSIVSGRVTTLTSFGAFVALNGDMEGLIHISDIDEGSHEHPSEVLSSGQQVRVVVLESDAARRRLHLGMRQSKDQKAAFADAVQVPYSEPMVWPGWDLSLYSRSVFLNFPVQGPGRTIALAAIFALLDTGLEPRVASNPEELVGAIRECQHAIHDVSQVLELGVYVGCKQYGSDVHQAKNMLLFTSEASGEVLGYPVLSHGNDPSVAIRHVTAWVSAITRKPAADPNEVWLRHQRFSSHRGAALANTKSLAGLIALCKADRRPI